MDAGKWRGESKHSRAEGLAVGGVVVAAGGVVPAAGGVVPAVGVVVAGGVAAAAGVAGVVGVPEDALQAAGQAPQVSWQKLP